jgi:hypothetical protein
MASHWRAALHKAADLLENPKTGWCQGAFEQVMEDGNLAYCAEGALQATITGEDLYLTALAEVEETLRERLGAPTTLAYWNDSLAGSAEEVVALLRYVAEERRS